MLCGRTHRKHKAVGSEETCQKHQRWVCLVLVQGSYSEAERPLTGLPTATNEQSVGGWDMGCACRRCGLGYMQNTSKRKKMLCTNLAGVIWRMQYSTASPLPCEAKADRYPGYLPVSGDFGGGWLGSRHRPKTGVYAGEEADRTERVCIGGDSRCVLPRYASCCWLMPNTCTSGGG